MVTCNKQDLSNIWNWINENVKQHWGLVEEKVLLLKKHVYKKQRDTLILQFKMIKD